MRYLVLLLGLTLAACGGTPPAPVAERDAANALRLARADFQRQRYTQAAASYARALEIAWRLDDLERLAAAGTERALALLRAGEAEAAWIEAADLDAELARRGSPPPPLLILVRAAAALATDRLDAAEAQLARLEPDAVDPLVQGRADYLRGRIAASRGDRAGLHAAIAALPESGPPGLVADRRELEARSALRDGRAEEALDQLTALAATRRALAEPAAVGETLALAGEAALAAGDTARAADLYLRAARNAVAIARDDLAETRLDAAARAAAAADDGEVEAAVAALRARLDAG